MQFAVTPQRCRSFARSTDYRQMLMSTTMWMSRCSGRSFAWRELEATRDGARLASRQSHSSSRLARSDALRVVLRKLLLHDPAKGGSIWTRQLGLRLVLELESARGRTRCVAAQQEGGGGAPPGQIPQAHPTASYRGSLRAVERASGVIAPTTKKIALAGSFAGWGISDVLGGGRGPRVAQVVPAVGSGTFANVRQHEPATGQARRGFTEKKPAQTRGRLRYAPC